MEQVSLHDGLEGRETIAFGLAAGEVAVFVVTLLTAYALLRSGLPAAIAWPLAGLIAGSGALLAWGRLAGRPLLEWALLLARFAVRTRRVRLQRLRECRRRWRLRASAVGLAHRFRRPAAGVRSSRRPPQAGAVVITLPLHRPHRAGMDAPGSETRAEHGRRCRSHVLAFFSLAGGTGRTALAVETAAMLALRGRALGATGARGMRVALLDLTERNPSVALRLGIALPSAAPEPAQPARLLSHDTGMSVFCGPAPALPTGAAAARWVGTLIETAEADGADIILVDIDCDLGDRCVEVLQRCDQVSVTLTPTAGGVLDAYRSCAVLRRLGLRHAIGYVVNRWHDGVDLGETMADLGGSISAEIPDDQSFVDAENRHRLAGRDGAPSVRAALTQLAARVERAAGAGQTPRAARRDSHAG